MVNSLSKRSKYETLNSFTYLNQASIGLISKNSIYSMKNFLDEIAQHGNAKMSDREEIEFLTPLRKIASDLFNCSTKNLAIVFSASEILNQLPYLFNVQDNSKVILVGSDFPALYRPWIAYSKVSNINLVFVDDKKEQNLTDTIIDEIDQTTKFVVVSYVQYSTGSMIDIFRLRNTTNKFGSKLIVDVTQAAGALPINFDKWKCDALICSGYKWLGGHGGVGIAALSNEIIKSVPLTPGWMGAENPFYFNDKSFDLASDARRFTQSTMSYVSIKCLETSIRNLINIGIVNIKNHSVILKKLLINNLKGLNWETYHNSINISSSPNIISLSNSFKNSGKIIQVLNENKIICSFRNEKLRVSLAHYNNESDIEKLIAILKNY